MKGWWIIAILFIIGGLLLFSCASKTGPTELPGLTIQVQWRLGQEDLYQMGVLYVRNVHPEQFTWMATDGPFPCAGAMANGCYSSNGVIFYNSQTPTVIRHEAKHAILHRLGHEWRCIEHCSEPRCFESRWCQ